MIRKIGLVAWLILAVLILTAPLLLRADNATESDAETVRQTPQPTLPAYSFEILNVRIHDADTVIGDVCLPWSITLRNQTIRAAGYDAWEVTRTRKTGDFAHFSDREWEIEIAKGMTARDAFRHLYEGGRMFIEWDQKSEKSVYGRIEGQLWVRLPNGELVNIEDWARSSKFVRD